MFKPMLIASALFLSFTANAATEGIEYQVLPESAQFDARNKVVKIYSINCPFCYKYEKAGIPNADILPEGITLEQYHITSKPPFGLEKTQTLAVAFNKSSESYKNLKNAYYEQYHVKKQKFTSADEVVDFALPILGMNKSEFTDELKKNDVITLIAKWDHGVEIAKIQGIPAITVNGKYLINTKSITSMEMLKSLILELSKK